MGVVTADSDQIQVVPAELEGAHSPLEGTGPYSDQRLRLHRVRAPDMHHGSFSYTTGGSEGSVIGNSQAADVVLVAVEEELRVRCQVVHDAEGSGSVDDDRIVDKVGVAPGRSEFIYRSSLIAEVLEAVGHEGERVQGVARVVRRGQAEHMFSGKNNQNEPSQSQINNNLIRE